MSFTRQSLYNAAGNARRKNLYCPFDNCGSGNQHVATFWMTDSSDSWLLYLKCSKCQQTWSICTQCTTITSAYINESQVSRHRRRYHQTMETKTRKRKDSKFGSSLEAISTEDDRKSNSHIYNAKAVANTNSLATTNKNNMNEKITTVPALPNPSQADSINFYSNENNECFTCDLNFPTNHSVSENNNELASSINLEMNDPMDSFAACKSILQYLNLKTSSVDITIDRDHIYSVNQNTLEYFIQDNIHKKGCEYLVCNAYFNNQKHIKAIMSEETMFQILLSKFINNLSRSQQKDFSVIISHLSALYCNQGSCSQISLHCDLPKSLADFHRLFLDGRYSVNKNLPRPESTLENNHSYVSILSCIAHTLGILNSSLSDLNEWNIFLNNSSNNNNDCTSILNCNRVKSLIEKMNTRSNEFKDNHNL